MKVKVKVSELIRVIETQPFTLRNMTIDYIEIDAEPIEEEKCERLNDFTAVDIYYRASPGLNQEFDNIYAILREMREGR